MSEILVRELASLDEMKDSENVQRLAAHAIGAGAVSS